jgi:hypothetical protein
MNCATCRHWDKEDDSMHGIPGLGLCEKIPLVDDATEWEMVAGETVNSLKEEYKDVLAFASDASSYQACLLTMPTFGCVMHEARRPHND